MSSPHRFRLTIGQWMGFVGILGVCLADIALEVKGKNWELRALSYPTVIVVPCVLLYNVRLSRWLWMAIAGYVGPLLSPVFFHSLSVDVTCTLLYALALAMAFRDVRRRLEGRENPS